MAIINSSIKCYNTRKITLAKLETKLLFVFWYSESHKYLVTNRLNCYFPTVTFIPKYLCRQKSLEHFCMNKLAKQSPYFVRQCSNCSEVLHSNRTHLF